MHDDKEINAAHYSIEKNATFIAGNGVLYETI